MHQFFFVDEAGGREARLAASILADGVARLGYPCSRQEESVRVDAPGGAADRQVLVLLDEALLDHPVIRAHLDGGTTLVIGSARPARVVLERLADRPASVVTVDATGIAFEEGTDPVAPLLGGAARTVSWIEPDVLCAAIWASYDREFGYGARAAIRAFDQGYRQAQEAVSASRQVP